VTPCVYVIGSMRNHRIPEVAERLAAITGYELFADWYSPGPDADDRWKEYELARGRSRIESLRGYHARHVFAFDKHHLDRSSACVLVLPAGKSGHLELGYMIGRGKPGYILLDEEDSRYDVMYQFATGVFEDIEELAAELRERFR